MVDHRPAFSYLRPDGDFLLQDPADVNERYFPLCNEAGMMACVTPMLHGDAKTGQETFLLPPVSIEDLYHSKAARNFWFFVEGYGGWSATGNSAAQTARRLEEGKRPFRSVEAGLLWHRIRYEEPAVPLRSDILSFVPVNQDLLEVTVVTVENAGIGTLRITPTSAVPLYGRSAENIRDHRHVTSLLNRSTVLPEGIVMQPVIRFDERGHQYNHRRYFALGCEGDGTLPIGSFPCEHEFVGASGGYDWPEAVVLDLPPTNLPPEDLDGKECVGALRFRTADLAPGERRAYVLLTGTCSDKASLQEIHARYDSLEKVQEALLANRLHWGGIAGKVSFETGDPSFGPWMRWVGVQPVFRKIYGCSFLPHHDYGKGGRGWRDLWQDCLSLVLHDPEPVGLQLLGHFGGVRVDGTNATIIGTRPGEFIADRNNIARVWMDHAAWPYLTTRLYLHQSGDFGLLLRRRSYFRDARTDRARKKDEAWRPEDGNELRTATGEVHLGTVIEHLLVEHLTAFFNVGRHNLLRLEGGDWNDTLDMAREEGESAAFTALYADNLQGLAELLPVVGRKCSISCLELFSELGVLLDSLGDPADYDDIPGKRARLDEYLNLVRNGISGKATAYSLEDLAQDLAVKASWMRRHLAADEWVETEAGDGFFNGYYNNDGNRVDGEFSDGVRMNLTAQTFAIHSGIASPERIERIHAACRRYLRDPGHGGFRLNTLLGDNQLNFGRGFAFAYGEKENGSTFCHMAVMYMNALYRRGFAEHGFEILQSLERLSSQNATNGMYPGIPEYFTPQGKGMYSYLTGSASWLLMTVLNECFGFRGWDGDLEIHPKLVTAQFDPDGRATFAASFAGIRVRVEYRNPERKTFGEYQIRRASAWGVQLSGSLYEAGFLRIPRSTIADLARVGDLALEILLD